MTKKNFARFKQDLEKGKIARVYLFLGPQEEQKKEGLRLLCNLLLAPGSEVFNLDQRKAGEVELPELENLVCTIPWGASKRIVAVSALDQFLLEQRHQLAELVRKVPDSTCLILLAEKLSEAEILYKAVQKAGEVVEFAFLGEDRILAWIEEKVQKEGKSIEPEAAERLAQALGSDLSELAAEVEKLVTYVGEKKRVALEDVNLHISSNPRFKVYQLIDFIAQNDVKNSLEVTREILISQGFAGIIINQLVQDYFYLWRIFTFSGSRSDFSSLAEHLGLARQAFRVSKYLTYSRNYNLKKIEQALQKICAVDIALRYGPLSAEGLVEQLVVELCQLSGRRESVRSLA